MPNHISHPDIWWSFLHLYHQLDVVALLDICLVAVAIYYLLALAQGTRAMQLLKGLAILLVIMKVAQWSGLDTLQWVIGQLIFASAVVVVILFQPELRAALDQLGRGHLDVVGLQWRSEASTETVRDVNVISKAVEQLAVQRVGALIAVERTTGLDDIAATGTALNARLSSDLLLSIFYPGNPLHDGAVVLRKNTIIAAACILPLSQTETLPRTVGTRHRAALGLSEMTDAIIVVVSEETGNISLAHNGTMNSILQTRLLNEELLSLLGGHQGAIRLRPWSVTKAARALPRNTLGTLKAAWKRH
ncbi:MAG: TIGR00159 family protein [Abitibacteriaceae bacterium]|nr:TIGR00159 family protein [Abditibacteriaceae bacterium]